MNRIELRADMQKALLAMYSSIVTKNMYEVQGAKTLGDLCLASEKVREDTRLAKELLKGSILYDDLVTVIKEVQNQRQIVLSLGKEPIPGLISSIDLLIEDLIERLQESRKQHN